MPVELNASKNDENQSPDKAADYARAKLEELIKIFDNDEQPYKSLVLPMSSCRDLRQLR